MGDGSGVLAGETGKEAESTRDRSPVMKPGRQIELHSSLIRSRSVLFVFTPEGQLSLWGNIFVIYSGRQDPGMLNVGKD